MDDSGLFTMPGPSACERERPEVDAALTLAKAKLQATTPESSRELRDMLCTIPVSEPLNLLLNHDLSCQLWLGIIEYLVCMGRGRPVRAVCERKFPSLGSTLAVFSEHEAHKMLRGPS